MVGQNSWNSADLCYPESLCQKGIPVSKRNLSTIRKSANVLAIGSHPDDIEFGCGGTLHKLAKQGHNVYLMVLTMGNVGGAADARCVEQERSAKILGAKEVFWGELEDTMVPFYNNVIQGIEKVVRKVKPSFVFVHFGSDTHQDHRHVSESTVAASRNVRNVLFYEGPTTFDFEPNAFVDIARHLNAKIKSLGCHKSQIMKTNVGHRSILEIAKATATFRGTQCRVACAEAFCSLRMFVLS